MFSVCNNKNEKNVFTRFLPEFEHKENLMNKAAASKYVSRFLEFLLGCCKVTSIKPVYYYYFLIVLGMLLEPICSKNGPKKNKGPLKVLNGIYQNLSQMITGITHLKSVWNPSGLSEVPYSPNQ